jgi:hypothetical protein
VARSSREGGADADGNRNASHAGESSRGLVALDDRARGRDNTLAGGRDGKGEAEGAEADRAEERGGRDTRCGGSTAGGHLEGGLARRREWTYDLLVIRRGCVCRKRPFSYVEKKTEMTYRILPLRQDRIQCAHGGARPRRKARRGAARWRRAPRTAHERRHRDGRRYSQRSPASPRRLPTRNEWVRAA